jgi:hypothetical protein
MTINAAFAVGLALSGVLSAAPVQAQNARSFVSGHGNDANPCTLAAPCRTFAGALAVTNAKGEIDILDAAGYGAVTINKAISIIDDGVGEAGVVAAAGNAITVNAGVNDKVVLRGLTIDGQGSGGEGIIFNSGKTLEIINCVVRNFTSSGIDIATTAATTFFITDTIVSDNGANGIAVEPAGAGTAEGHIERTVAVNNNNGILVLGSNTTGATVNVTISNSVASGNTSPGILSITLGAATTVMVINTKSNNNGYGYYTGSNGVMWIAGSAATTNVNYGVYRSGGSMFSFGDNYFIGNGNGNSIFGGLTGTLARQ